MDSGTDELQDSGRNELVEKQKGSLLRILTAAVAASIASDRSPPSDMFTTVGFPEFRNSFATNSIAEILEVRISHRG